MRTTARLLAVLVLGAAIGSFLARPLAPQANVVMPHDVEPGSILFRTPAPNGSTVCLLGPYMEALDITAPEHLHLVLALTPSREAPMVLGIRRFVRAPGAGPDVLVEAAMLPRPAAGVPTGCVVAEEDGAVEVSVDAREATPGRVRYGLRVALIEP